MLALRVAILHHGRWTNTRNENPQTFVAMLPVLRAATITSHSTTCTCFTMVFFFGSTNISRRCQQRGFGQGCMKCGGTVDLVEESRQFMVFCCIPTTPRAETLVQCQQCGFIIRAAYYNPPTPAIADTENKPKSKTESTPILQGEAV